MVETLANLKLLIPLCFMLANVSLCTIYLDSLFRYSHASNVTCPISKLKQSIEENKFGRICRRNVTILGIQGTLSDVTWMVVCSDKKFVAKHHQRIRVGIVHRQEITQRSKVKLSP
jgi:hypothetical protein